MDKRVEVKGIWAAVMTPYEEGGKVSGSTMEKFMEFFLEKKLDGIFPVSNVGEFAALSFQERCRIIEICTSMGKGKIRICPGVTDLNLDQALALAEFSERKGADGVVISSPYYYPYKDRFVEEYLRIFLRKSPLPVILYHSPKFAHPMREEFLLELLADPKVAALKESSGDARFLISLLEKIKTSGLNVKVMLGWEELLLTGLIHGADGCITSCGGIVPEILKKIYSCYQKGDLHGAAVCQQSICRITEKLGACGLPCGYKMGMAARISHRILQADRMQKLEGILQREVLEIRDILDRELALLR